MSDQAPLTVKDLEADVLEKATNSTLPNALAKALHRMCVQHERDCYIDPISGYHVWSMLFLKRRPCCGNKCRHCPWGHVNVPKKQAAANKFDW